MLYEVITLFTGIGFVRNGQDHCIIVLSVQFSQLKPVLVITSYSIHYTKLYEPFKKTEFTGLMIFEPVVFEDSRGYFFESYNADIFRQQAGLDIHFVQDNQSSSSYGVIRGLHYQLNPHAQTKLVRVLTGKIRDVVVDIRKGSPTFGRHIV